MQEIQLRIRRGFFGKRSRGEGRKEEEHGGNGNSVERLCSVVDLISGVIQGSNNLCSS